jgi:hypothetical protein
MKVRDRVAIVGLLVVLVAIAAAQLMPSAAKPVASPMAAVSEIPYREGVLGHPSSINPLTPRSQADKDLIALLFRGLVREGPDGSLLPDLAESWTVGDDGRTYTFQLRDDAYWEDGYHVTATDVVFTVNVLQSSRYTGPVGASWQGVHATAQGVYTVRMTMSLANAGFLRLASQPIVPEHLLENVPIEQMADSDYSSHPIGDGPYRIVHIDYSGALLQRVTSVVPPTTPGPSVAAVRIGQCKPDAHPDGQPDAREDADSQAGRHARPDADRAAHARPDADADADAQPDGPAHLDAVHRPEQQGPEPDRRDPARLL